MGYRLRFYIFLKDAVARLSEGQESSAETNGLGPPHPNATRCLWNFDKGPNILGYIKRRTVPFKRISDPSGAAQPSRRHALSRAVPQCGHRKPQPMSVISLRKNSLHGLSSGDASAFDQRRKLFDAPPAASGFTSNPLHTHQDGAERGQGAFCFTREAVGGRSAGHGETNERLAESGAYGFFHLARDIPYKRRECARDMGTRTGYLALARKRDGPAV